MIKANSVVKVSLIFGFLIVILNFQNCSGYRFSARQLDSSSLGGTLRTSGDSSSKSSFGPDDFVKRVKNEFELDGKRFRFTSSTYPFLMHFAGLRKSDSLTDPYAAYVDEVFRQQQKMGTKVLRIWADPEVQAAGWGRAMGYSEKQVNDLGLRYRSGLDFVIDRAEQYGIRLILVLYHPWPVTAFAPRAYNYEMLLKCSPSDAVSENSVRSNVFFTKPACVYAYMDMINKVFLRKNSYKKGLEYRYDPTILSWELMTEPSDYGTTGPADRIVENWISAVAVNVRTHLNPKQLLTVSLYADDLPANRGLYSQTNLLSPSQLLAVFSGSAPKTSMKDIFQIPALDYADVHLYLGEQANIPFWSGLSNTQGSVFLYEIVATAKALGKPIVVSEFGVTARSLPNGCKAASETCPWIEKDPVLLEQQMSEFMGYGFIAGVDGMITWHVEIDPTRLVNEYPTIWKAAFKNFFDVDWNAIYVTPKAMANPNSAVRRWIDWTYAFSG